MLSGCLVRRLLGASMTGSGDCALCPCKGFAKDFSTCRSSRRSIGSILWQRRNGSSLQQYLGRWAAGIGQRGVHIDQRPEQRNADASRISNCAGSTWRLNRRAGSIPAHPRPQTRFRRDSPLSVKVSPSKTLLTRASRMGASSARAIPPSRKSKPIPIATNKGMPVRSARRSLKRLKCLYMQPLSLGSSYHCK